MPCVNKFAFRRCCDVSVIFFCLFEYQYSTLIFLLPFPFLCCTHSHSHSPAALPLHLMATILDLPVEIHLLIGMQLGFKTNYSCIRVCRSFYSAYIPCRWSSISVKIPKCSAIRTDLLRTNAHHIETLTFSPELTPDYYTIVFPRLRYVWMLTFSYNKNDHHYPQIQPHHMVQFAQHHSNIRKLSYDQPNLLSKEF